MTGQIRSSAVISAIYIIRPVIAKYLCDPDIPTHYSHQMWLIAMGKRYGALYLLHGQDRPHFFNNPCERHGWRESEWSASEIIIKHQRNNGTLRRRRNCLHVTPCESHSRLFAHWSCSRNYTIPFNACSIVLHPLRFFPPAWRRIQFVKSGVGCLLVPVNIPIPLQKSGHVDHTLCWIPNLRFCRCSRHTPWGLKLNLRGLSARDGNISPPRR